MMLNQTTGDLRPSIAVRHIEPVYNIKIILRDIPGGVKNIYSVTGNNLDWKIENGECVVALDKINDYDALIVELGDVIN